MSDPGAAIARRLGAAMAVRLFSPPQRRPHRHPADFGLSAEERHVRTRDGVDIHLWVVGGGKQGTLILGHGVGLSKSASLPHAALAAELGWSVVLFDHRNHGLSGKGPATDQVAVRYTQDIEAALGFVTDEPGWLPRPVVVWGFSISTFPTVFSLWDDPAGLDAIICDSGPVLDVAGMLHELPTRAALPVPRPVKALLRRPRVRAAFSAAAIEMLAGHWPPDPATTVAGRIPMLFLAGRGDELFDLRQVRALAAHYPQAQFAELDCGHLQGLRVDPAGYRSTVSGFLQGVTGALPL